ncbi:RcnB family protein [Paucibacter sp. TC2R-5]|uniref:RcnB family protein n=1 Tax=Paucibacter sp. TC2R-5 TaxID=2893555 RepID=UPI0021E39155|nr:RcnB family protein [Paucibacter sp. TC2R-5]MCV2360553.1 RcnB family protein [Paucibacter sp. TC2R-5]
MSKKQQCLSGLLVMSLLLSGGVQAQPHDKSDKSERGARDDREDQHQQQPPRRDDKRRDEPREQRRDPRYEQRSDGRYDSRQGGRYEGRGAGPDFNYYRGQRLPSQYRQHPYVVQDWRAHQLYAPPRGYHWVQSGDDYLLVAIATGVILQLMLSH